MKRRKTAAAPMPMPAFAPAESPSSCSDAMAVAVARVVVVVPEASVVETGAADEGDVDRVGAATKDAGGSDVAML